MTDCEHMTTFPRPKYILVIEHLENDLRSISVSDTEIQRIKREAHESGNSVITALRNAYKEYVK